MTATSVKAPVRNATPIAESLASNLLVEGFFPARPQCVPFGKLINEVFFRPIADKDYPIHGPNVIRFVKALLTVNFDEPGLISKPDQIQAAQANYLQHYPSIEGALGEDDSERRKARDLLIVAALYHDIGKSIRRENHPQVGANLLRSYSEDEQKALVRALQYEREEDSSPAKHNRFSLIGSIVQHHDKFGVVSTGEGGLPLFSDILYFTSDDTPTSIRGIKKNITSVMLANMADIAAVNTAEKPTKKRSLELAEEVARARESNTKAANTKEKDTLHELTKLMKQPESCLGLSPGKINCVLEDWAKLIEAIDHKTVKGNRVPLKIRLIELERNPARTIRRILRLLQAAATSNLPELFQFMSPTSVEAVLVSTLGAHQFQTFCERLATIAKLDYGLKFFKAVLCACVRRKLAFSSVNRQPWNRKKEQANVESEDFGALTKSERDRFNTEMDHDLKAKTATSVTTLFVKVLESLVSRYAGVLETSESSNPRRFGFQMRDLTNDPRVRATIINLLCLEEEKDAMALTWIADEVTIWSMD